MPKRIAVTVVKIKNFNTGISEICAHKLTTRAVEQPMISRPPMISPQRMLLSSMKELRTSLKGRRGARGGGGVVVGVGVGRAGSFRGITATGDPDSATATFSTTLSTTFVFSVRSG